MTPEDKVRDLLVRYREGRLSANEKRLLDAWYNRAASESGLEIGEAELEEMVRSMADSLPLVRPGKVRSLWPRIAAAASVILVLGAGGYFLLREKEKPVQESALLYKNDIAPGHNQATLTLADGRKVVLRPGMSGKVAVQGATNIKAAGGQLVYEAGSAGQAIGYNTVSTARGEQSPFPLVLADGTKVWLNAESGITYPTAFSGRERVVKLTGEAYFEVKHDALHPFKVLTTSQTVEDIGTEFDVNAYGDEPVMRTTLVEGKVRVNGLVLKPGEQMDGASVRSVNTEVYTAWRGGKFHFEGEDIGAVMRQLARWYNIDVVYEGVPVKHVFYATLSRNRNISGVLKILQNTMGVHFRIEGRRVTVIG